MAIIYVVKSALITKLGGSSNMTACVEEVAKKWPKADDAQTYSLKEIHERMVEAKHHGHRKGHGKEEGDKGHQPNSMASVAASMNVANVLKAKTSQKHSGNNSGNAGGSASGAKNAPPPPPPLAAAKLSQAAARLSALEKPSNVPGRALPFRPPAPAPAAAAAAASKPNQLKKSASNSKGSTSSSSSKKASKLTVDTETNHAHEAKEEESTNPKTKSPPTSPKQHHRQHRRSSVRTQNIVDELGVDPADVARFQAFYLLWLRTTNVFQAFYIALIFAHWAWYAPSHLEALAMVLPLVVVYLVFTPLLVYTRGCRAHVVVKYTGR